MPIVEITVPQMGEGLQEVMLVELVRKPGETVRRDEVLYSMETDKATMEVESPHDGVLTEWLAAEGDTLSIGAPVARMEIADAPSATTPPASDADLRTIPPRTRAYAREKGVADEVLARVPAAGARLMPADIDAFLAKLDAAAATPAAPLEKGAWTETPLSPLDRTFLYRLRRSAGLVIPATAKRPLDWSVIRAVADRKKAQGGAHPPSAFNCIAWCIARAVREHPRFRSTLIREEAVRTFDHVNLGIAVSMESGELTTAVVRDADALSFDAFVQESHDRIAAARAGQDQADEATQLVLTYMGPFEVTDAVPVLVAPAAAVLFIGAPFQSDGKPTVNLVLTFDHRLIHGIEAAEFLRTIARIVGELETLLP